MKPRDPEPGRPDPPYPELENIVGGLAGLPQVEAVLLGGSRAASRTDGGSDYDLYVYTREEIAPAVRRERLLPHFSYLELDNRYWETEDDGILSDSGIPVDIIYRNLEETDRHLHGLLFEYRASVGYTTTLWANVTCSIPLFDRNGHAAALQARYGIPYPRQLTKSIVGKNFPLLRGYLPSYDAQIDKALRRSDPVSVNHRVAAFLASYFDILFALNAIPHPGEKRILEILVREAGLLPENMEADVRFLLETSPSDGERLRGTLHRLTDRLETLLGAQKLF